MEFNSHLTSILLLHFSIFLLPSVVLSVPSGSIFLFQGERIQNLLISLASHIMQGTPRPGIGFLGKALHNRRLFDCLMEEMMKMALRRIQSGLLILAAVTGLGLMSPAMAQDRLPDNIITVQGTGAVTAQPDSMTLNIGVETEGKTVEAARNSNAEKMNAIIRQLKALGIPGLQLKTAGFNVQPIRESEPSPVTSRRTVEKIVGYRAYNNLEAKIEGADADRLSGYASRILDTAMAAGANNTSGPNFYMGRENPAQQEALRLAVAQARKHAEAVASAAGVTLTGVYSIEAYAQPIAMRSYAMAAPDVAEMRKAGTPIESGTMDVTANVTVRFDFND